MYVVQLEISMLVNEGVLIDDKLNTFLPYDLIHSMLLMSMKLMVSM